MRLRTPEENAANAKLIRSAPDLLDALKRFAEVHGPAHEEDCPGDDTCHCKWKPVNDAVNSSINSAEGR